MRFTAAVPVPSYSTLTLGELKAKARKNKIPDEARLGVRRAISLNSSESTSDLGEDQSAIHEVTFEWEVSDDDD